MAEASAIEWCDSTFNPWIGCQKVSAACDHCYAEAWARRFNGPAWGPHADRRRTSPATWAQPRKWQREADAFDALRGRPRFVFCASLADVFDNAVPEEWRADLWALIRECDRLVWLLLTKRPQNIAAMLPADWGDGWGHVWLGATVEHQVAAELNIPPLLGVPAARRFLSCEPLLGAIDLSAIDTGWTAFDALAGQNWIPGQPYGARRVCGLDWVIAGGESGPKARPSHPDWFRSLRDQCADAAVPFLFKQWGEWIPWEEDSVPLVRSQHGRLEDRHGLFPADFDDSTRWDHGLWMIADHGESVVSERVGKKAAGRTLDGQLHDGRPEVMADA